MIVPIELRRLLIGDPYGDFNFLKFPNETSPITESYPALTPYQRTTERWFQRGNIGSFLGGIRSLHSRYMRASYGPSEVGVSVAHAATSFAAGAVARFGLGGNPTLGGQFVLGKPDGVAVVTPTSGNTFYELRWTQPAQGWWRVAVNIPASGGTQDLDEVRLWEFIDIEPYLEDLIPADSDTEVFQMPFGRYFVGTHYRWTAKRLTITLLFSRTETTLRKQLEGLLTKPSVRYPLELFVDGYLFRCAPESLRFEPVGGLVARAVIELQLLKPYGYHQNRYVVVSPPTYPSSSEPILLSVGNNLITAETPCEVRVNPGSTVNGYKIRVRVVPADQTAILVLNGTEAGKVISFREDGKVYIASKDTATTVADVTNQVDISSQLPFVLHPGTNLVFVEYLDSNNNPLSHTVYWQIACAFNPRTGEVVGL
jgi:hypothetical protein